ncbi:glycosyltransferase family 4 protein [Candidatus Omnitrophota bacterium]
MIHPHDIWSVHAPWTSRIRNIAREFVKAGHAVRIVYFEDPAYQSCEPQEDVFESFKLYQNKRYIFSNIAYITKHAQWADVIHFQKCFPHAAIPAVYAHVVHNKPIHYDWDDWELQIYNYDPPCKIHGKFLEYIENILPRLVDTISVASERLRKRACELNFSKEKIYTAHVCADLELFYPKKADLQIKNKFNIHKPVVMYMGQLHGGQYVRLFIDAAVKVAKSHDVTFMIVGAGNREQLLIQHAIEQGLSKHLIFTGAVEHETVPDYLSIADVAVACFEDNELTRSKSPLKIVEYLACGKAIVASDVGEVSRMLNGCGVLVEPGSVDSLVAGITQLLDDPRKRSCLEQQARPRAEDAFSWSVTAKNILSAYDMARSFYNGTKTE